MFLYQSRQSNRVAICNFVWKDKKQESFITFDLDKIFAWNFHDVWDRESTMSNLCHIFLWEICFVKKVNYNNRYKWRWLMYLLKYVHFSDNIDICHDLYTFYIHGIRFLLLRIPCHGKAFHLPLLLFKGYA